MNELAAVALGGACGAALRYWLGQRVENWLQQPFPSGTLTVNVIGSLLIGVLFVLALERGQWPAVWRVAIITGLLGGFTTFSAFSLDALLLLQQGRPLTALAYVGVSVAGCLLAAALGMLLARFFFIS